MTKEEIIGLLKSGEANFLDVRFVDSTGGWHHMCVSGMSVDEDLLNNGIAFDGSSIDGWAKINNSDMFLEIDPSTAFLDPFLEHPTIAVIASILDPRTKKRYIKDPRSTAERALGYLQSSGIADKAYMGPELEFFVFDHVSYNISPESTFFQIDSAEGAWNTGDPSPYNKGLQVPFKGGYIPTPPMDSLQDIRSEISEHLRSVNFVTEHHHHEVATAGQCEINFRFGDLVETADRVMIFKYITKNTAAMHDKIATFMPKPLAHDNGSGMHTHQSLWKDGENLFAGDAYAGLSEMALYYIGGILKHGQAIAAFTNPSVNSYKRLIPGYEAPVYLAYSAMNRTASIRIPANGGDSPKAKRIEVRFPDPSCNPYLAFSAMLMAGIDGIKNKILPGDPSDKNLYKLPEEEKNLIPTLPGSLWSAMEALRKDSDFLLEGGVFTQEFIDSYIKLKEEEIGRVLLTPHPEEFSMYLNC